MEKKLKQSIMTSYLIGAPIGIFVVCATIFVPSFLFGEGLMTIVILGTYGISTIGLVVAFLIALWIGGKLAYKNIKSGKSLLLTSFKYSTAVNLIIWTTFCLIIGLTVAEERFLMMIPPIIAFVVCTILTTFSIGLLISYMIKRINNKQTELKNTVANNSERCTSH
jgi:bacteriorhodopsin